MKKFLLALAIAVFITPAFAEGIAVQTRVARGDYASAEDALRAARLKAETDVLDTLAAYLDVPSGDFTATSSVERFREAGGFLTARVSVETDLEAMWEKSENTPPLPVFVVMDAYFEGKADTREIGLSVFLQRLVRDLDIARPELYLPAVKNVALDSERIRIIMETARKKGVYFVLFASLAVSSESVVTDNEKRSKAVLGCRLKSSVTGKTLWSTSPAVRADYVLTEGNMFERSAGNVCDIFYEQSIAAIKKAMTEAFLTEKYYETRSKK